MARAIAPYAEWAQRWAQGMEAAAPHIQQRAAAQRDVAIANRANATPCGMKGCTRHSYKGRLCRKHYAMVPMSDKIALSVECMVTTRRIAAKHHRRFLRELRNAVT